MITIDPERRGKNKLTITAHKQEVRIKLQQGNTPEEDKEVLNFFERVLQEYKDYPLTLRGSVKTDSLFFGIVMQTNNKETGFGLLSPFKNKAVSVVNKVST